MFKITEFSKITGLTIRTLQYYDEIGLLIPNREKNDHRTYSYNDL
ncbi:TPA: MerR family DNA-binding transcriptional regulator, partial [Streptococcus suis]